MADGVKDWLDVASAIGSAVGGLGGLAGALIAAFATWLVICQLRQQNDSKDMAFVVDTHRLMDESWHRLFGVKDDALRRFYFGQVLGAYETVCFILNKKKASADVVAYLRDSIIPVLTQIVGDSSSREEMKVIGSNRDAYKEMKAFFASHKAIYPDEWGLLKSVGWLD